MHYTDKIQKGINTAVVLHNCQIRKADGLPYINHPFSVAFILTNYTDNEDTIIAGLLHDVLEDVIGYGENDMRCDFGEKITSIVKEVSEDKEPQMSRAEEKATWQSRKEKYLINIRNGSFEARMVCAADKIHNMKSIIAGYEKDGEKIFKKFNAPLNKRTWFYEETFKILKNNLKNKIVDEFRKILGELKTLAK